MCVPACWSPTDVACCLCVGILGLAPITHRKQALALSSTLNTQEIHTGNRGSSPCARLTHSSVPACLSSRSQRRAGRQSPAAHSADNLSNFFAVCTVCRSPSDPLTPHPPRPPLQTQTYHEPLEQNLFLEVRPEFSLLSLKCFMNSLSLY